MQDIETTASFRILKKELLKVIKKLQKVEKSAEKKESTLEVTIVDDYLQFVIPGVQLRLRAATRWSAKFTLRLWYFADIVKSEDDNTLHFDLTENQLKLRILSFPVFTTFFQTDKILRSINLPVNYTENDIINLYLSEKYTDQEIIFNNIEVEVVKAIQKIKKVVDKLTPVLKGYGISKAEIEYFIKSKMKE